MNQKLLFAIAVMLGMTQFQSVIHAQALSSDTVWVYYLGGQSNMDGHGYTKELQERNHEVWIFLGNPVSDDLPDGGLGLWEPLMPGHGAGFSSDGKSNELSARFGIELSLARCLQELYTSSVTDRLSHLAGRDHPVQALRKKLTECYVS